MLLPVGSATAVVLVVAAAILVTLGRITDYRSAWRLPALLLIGVTPFLAVLCRGALLPLLGRTPSLNGRVVVWEHMADVVMRRPLLGYGYRLSWTDVPALQIDLVQHGRPWQASMHSGYVSVGVLPLIVGALLLALLLLSMLWSSAKRFRDGEPGVDRTLPLALLVLLLLAAVPEERMLLPASYHTVLLALLAFHLHEPLPRRVVGAGAALVLLCFGIGCQPSSPGLFLGFEEVSGRWGIGELDARGVCILDLENDGDADMLWVRAGGSTLLENEAPGRFADVSEARGISGFGNSLGCAALDLDRDGDTDLLITDNDGPTLLLRNDGSGHFSDATAEAGLADQSGQASIAAADADGDGELDLLLSGVQDKASALLFGDGAGGYVQSTLLPQLDAIQRSWAAAWIDTDNDMLPELFVGTDQPARPGFRDSNDLLLGNLGGREFRDITEEFAIGNSENAMGLAVADVNQDGFLDLYVTNIGHQPLFLSSGNGSFVDTSLSLGLGNHGRAPGWGSFWFDPDDDGLEDLFVVLGGYYGQTLKSESPLHLPRSTDLLFRRLSDRLEFEDQAGDLGLADGAVGRGAVWADPDGDQLFDVVVANIEGGASRVYRNLGVSGGSAAWRVRLRGVLSNPEAIGARAVLTACGRSQQRAVSSGPSLLSQGELTLHFGAGGCREDAELLVRWPSGLVQEWSLPGPGATWDLVEGRDL